METDPRRVRPIGRVRWLIITWTLVIAAVSYLDRNNISIAVSSIQKEFGFSNVQIGGLFSAFVLGYALMQPLAGQIADRVGPYGAIAGAIVWWSVFTVLVTVVPAGVGGSLVLFAAVRFLLGAGEAVIFPASNRLVASWIPSRERGLANGLIFAGVGVGGGVAPPLITWLMLAHSWRLAFWVSAAIGLVAGAVWLVLVRNRPQEHPWVKPEEAKHIAAGLPASPDAPSARLRWRDIALDRQVALLTLSYFCYGYVAYIFFTWFFKYLSDVRGLDLKASALYATLPFIAMAAASSLGGWLSDALIRPLGLRMARCGVAGLSLAAAAAFIWAATEVADARLAALVLAGGAGALYLAQSAYWALSADFGGGSAGALAGLMNMGCQLGGAVTASLTALVASAFGWTASFETAAGVCLVGALAWLFVDPSHRVGRRAAPAGPRTREAEATTP